MTSGRLPPPDEVVERALAASRGEACSVIVEETNQAEVRFANNTTTTNGVRRDRRVVVVSFAVVRRGEGASAPGPSAPAGAAMAVGVASRSGDVDVEDLVRASEAEARHAPAAADAAELVGPAGDAPDFGEEPGSTSVGVLAPVTSVLGDAFVRARQSGHVLAGFATHGVSSLYLGTSTGLRRRHVQGEGTVELVARSADGTRSAWAGVGTQDFSDVDVAALERRVVERLAWAERAVEMPAGRYEVVLPPDAVADLMVALSEALSGRDAEEGRNAFAKAGGGTRVGDRLATLPFELRGDPADPDLRCLPFVATGASGTDVSVFDNGLDIGRTRWIDDGRLARLRYHRAGAAAAGVDPAPPVGNLTLELPGATATLDDMVAATRRALLVTCLWYIREVDPVSLLLTGLTRDGVYLVEDGEVVGAVNNFRFNESPLAVLGRIIEAGRAERALSREWSEWMSRTAMAPLRVADFNMSSVSPAT
ncbi:MAG TPA: metallopeptidase TldD-related protein [Acidimicrobiales bacterium]|nr:metallopeptidase TldD-related protein [Acidimicrobiales bacterium]